MMIGFFVGFEFGERFGEEIDEDEFLRLSGDVLTELQGAEEYPSHSTPQDELDKLNGRDVRRGEQPGEANF